jgi:hypothetical protein
MSIGVVRFVGVREILVGETVGKLRNHYEMWLRVLGKTWHIISGLRLGQGRLKKS